MLEEIRARAGVTTPVRIESQNYVRPPLGWQVREWFGSTWWRSLGVLTGSHEPEEVNDLIRIGSVRRHVLCGRSRRAQPRNNICDPIESTRTLGLGHGRSG